MTQICRRDLWMDSSMAFDDDTRTAGGQEMHLSKEKS